MENYKYTKDQEAVLDLLANDITQRMQNHEPDLEAQAESERKFHLYEQRLLDPRDI